MALLADSIGLGQPGRDFIIDIIHALEAKRVQMILWRKSFDAPKTRIFQSAREDDVAVDPVSANDERRKTHSDLKSDSGFFRKHGDRPVVLRDRQQFVEDGTHRRRPVGKMRGQRVTAARV